VSGGSKTTTTTSGNTSQATTLPQWMTDAAKQTFDNASNAVAAHPTQAYQGEMTPGMTANQTNAGNLAASSVGTGQSDLAAARALTMASTAGPMTVSAQAPTAATWQAAQTGHAPTVTTDMWSQDAADRYMNPYLKTVQGNTLSTMRDQDAQDVAALNDQIAGANAFGGTRGALMQTETQKNQSLQRQNYVDQSTADAYNNAQQMFTSDEGRKLSADQGNASLYDQMLSRNQAAENSARSSNANATNSINVGNADRSLTADTTNANGWQQMLDRIAAGGRTMGDIGTSSSNLTGADISRLEGTGATAQQTQGAADSAAYNDWLRTQNGDVDQYKDLMAILAGAPRNVTTTGTSSGTSVQKTDPGLIGTALGLGQLGVSAYSAGMFSDVRLKRDVHLIETRKGLGIYSYRYLWEGKGVRHIGVMAQEVARIRPSALGPRVFGYMTVNYRKLLEGGLLA
jgi:hypothetical protein